MLSSAGQPEWPSGPEWDNASASQLPEMSLRPATLGTVWTGIAARWGCCSFTDWLSQVCPHLGFLTTTPPGCLARAQTLSHLPRPEAGHLRLTLPVTAAAATTAPKAASWRSHAVMPQSCPSSSTFSRPRLPTVPVVGISMVYRVAVCGGRSFCCPEACVKDITLTAVWLVWLIMHLCVCML